MTPETFFENFALLADAPNGVQQLRALILQLAVQGKLVPQDPNDEPASVLLERIRAEKARLTAEGKIKKEKALPVLTDDEKPFELPSGWEWVRLGQVALISTGYAFQSQDYSSTGTFILRVTNISERGTISKDDAVYIPEEKITSRIKNYYLSRGDILVVMVGGSLGKIGYVTPEILPALLNQNMWRVNSVANGMNTEYLILMLRYINSYQLKITHSTHGHLAMGEYIYQPLGLPPLAEQRRIVAKVDQLMALCDQLESRQQQRRAARTQLNDAALDQLLAAREPDEFATHWRRVRDNFDVLYDTPETIGKLRQAILQLAVQGKLVPQDPNDEPATVLLEQIRAKKLRLIKEGKIRKSEPLPAIESTEMTFESPQGWVWTRFGEVTICRDGERIPLERSVRATRQGPYDYYGASGVIDKMDDYLFDEPLLLIGEDGANLVNRSTPIAFIAQGKYWVNNHAHVLDSLSFDCLRYLEVFINAIDLKPYVTGTAQPKMNQAKMNSIPVSWPPAEEQRRIVAKVDQLMALCDELEAKLKEAQEHSAVLLEAVVRQVLADGVTTA